MNPGIGAVWDSATQLYNIAPTPDWGRAPGRQRPELLDRTRPVAFGVKLVGVFHRFLAETSNPVIFANCG